MIRVELMSKVIITTLEEVIGEDELTELVLSTERYLNSLSTADLRSALRFHFDGDTVKVTASTL